MLNSMALNTLGCLITLTSASVSMAQVPPTARENLIDPNTKNANLLVPILRPVVDFGSVVGNVVSAKVVDSNGEKVLLVVKFGQDETVTDTSTQIGYKPETRTRTVNVNGEVREEKYTIQVPYATTVTNERKTLTEKDRSIPIDQVQAFDLQGKLVKESVWTKRLATPKHVLLLKKPLSETDKLNAFYVELLREDVLLLFLKK